MTANGRDCDQTFLFVCTVPWLCWSQAGHVEQSKPVIFLCIIYCDLLRMISWNFTISCQSNRFWPLSPATATETIVLLSLEPPLLQFPQGLAPPKAEPYPSGFGILDMVRRCEKKHVMPVLLCDMRKFYLIKQLTFIIFYIASKWYTKLPSIIIHYPHF